ncbi:MAG: class I SAM-dependent methyltransferase [Chloroflexota bacterium]|jgi:predicted O-methyltransferase YrrM|nr:class I SAM-dependent methyltransferase [Lentimicrobium sp.]
MPNKLQQLFKYSLYLKNAKTKHGVHSPFVFDLITKVFEDRTVYPVYNRVEETRKKLLHNRNLLEIVDFGANAGRAGYTTSFEKVKDIARRSSITPKQGQLLYRLVRYFKPDVILELGTSLGMSSIYQVSGSPDSFFIGMEGCATTAAIAEENLKRYTDPQNYSMVIGNFNTMLTGVIEKIQKVDFVFLDGNHAYRPTLHYFSQLMPIMHDESVMVIHDIYWSRDMEKAWQEIKNDARVTISIDLYRMGIIFFRKGMPKQDFILRF